MLGRRGRERIPDPLPPPHTEVLIMSKLLSGVRKFVEIPKKKKRKRNYVRKRRCYNKRYVGEHVFLDPIRQNLATPQQQESVCEQYFINPARREAGL